jgi:YidC/Oxa1 family membrane protein insertase
MNETRNLIFAVGLSMVILLAWNYFFERPQLAKQQQLIQQQKAETPKIAPISAASVAIVTAEQARSGSPRVRISSPSLHGSIALKGARLDDLTLAGYKETTAKDAPEVVLFSPAGTAKVYFAQFGWLGEGAPDEKTLWRADGAELTPQKPVTLSWVNPQGVKFSIRIALDEHYLFTLSRKVENTSGQAITLSPFGLLSRARPEAEHFFILHEGPLGVLNGTLNEAPFHKLKEEKKHTMSGEGWLGISDKYWLAAMVPAKGENVDANATYYSDQGDRYQVDYTAKPLVIPAGSKIEEVTHLFAGAKKIALLDQYQDQLGLTLFDRAIDYGWFYFLTKPMAKLLNWLYLQIGNFGLALMALTVFIKMLMFPLANKSYRAMSQMKRLSPKIAEMREKYGDDKMKLNQAVMEFYKKEKVNPVSGCLPVILQIPVFFALYKVLFVTIEMRHAPFYGWIRDLSAPDPTNIFTLFGLLPFVPPTFLHLGIWPIIMGITMIIQQKLNPPPSDPAQAKVIAMMPYFFVFVFASFPAGLVIYWSWSNLLSILQQRVMMGVVDKEAEAKQHKIKK